MNCEVTAVEPGLVTTSLGSYRASLVVVAAGRWTQELLPQYPQVGQKGVSFLWPGMEMRDPFVHPYAPYRQFVAFNRGDGVWAGDGTAIKRENWTDERVLTSILRTRDYLPEADFPADRMETLIGVRPYAKGHKPCLIEEVDKGLWVASGGAKNGTVAAGYCAHVIREATS